MNGSQPTNNSPEPVAVPIIQSEQPLKEYSPQASGQQLSDEGLSLTEYEHTHQMPYVADYMGLSDLYGTSSVVKSLVDRVGKYLSEETPDQLTFVAKQRLLELGQLANISDSDAPLYRLKQIHKVLMMQRKSGKLKKMKAQVLADINNIS